MPTSRNPSSRPAPGAKSKSSSARKRDPEGGLTAAGRKYFAEKEGAHLRPGVQGEPKTPEEARRKGSFLKRFYGRKQPSPLTDEHGEPTRYAKAAHAWGEKVPKTDADVQRLARKGDRLLEQAKASKGKK